MSASILAGIQAEEPYFPVPLASLRPDTVTGFDLYLRSDPDQPPVLYREKHLPFTEQVRERLEISRVEVLYIQTAQAQQYRRYIEQNLGAILTDKKLPMEDKSEVLYTTAQGLVREMLQDPSKGDAIQRSAGLAESTVQFMHQQKTAFEHLLKVTSYDYQTYTHSVNVCVYAVALAQRAYRLDFPTLLEFGQGALFHDVGKSMIDPLILNSRTRLSDEQWEIMKRHPVLGYDLLEKADGLGDIGLDIVRHHHEKISGKGYPDGLRGGSISPYVRMVAVADVFDALTTRRPHRQAMSSFKALKLMHEEMLADLDKELFTIFVKMMGNPRGD
ncbi:MAG TPA: HD domain-containing protein [Candidatus Hydrogenedentes bacterium]|nr:HD domain-containing protein [Candidatus Hydrogenedentota bacterium]HIJ74547.1 HD domain-containing protein [Candidatus Hydrogenedentota bacterium]